MMRSARRENGRVWSQTVPWPLSVARNIPSPPKIMDFRLPARWMSYSMPGVKATRQPVSTRNVSPLNSFLMMCPPAWMNAIPSPQFPAARPGRDL